MNTILAPLRELGEYEDIQKQLNTQQGKVSISGCVDSQKLHMVYGLTEKYDVKLIVTYSDMKAKELLDDCKLYCRESYYFPAKDLIFYQADIHSNQLIKERVAVLRKLLEGEPITIVTTFSALMAHQLPLSVWQENVIEIEEGGIAEEAAIARQLVKMGYEKNYQVEAPGQFSVRGGIVDIFDLTRENPVRIELWGDEVESIRSFDIESQRSIEKLTEVSIYPATELILSKKALEDGLARMEKDCKKSAAFFREGTKPEEAHRLEQAVAELKEQVTQFQSFVNLESYIGYFYEETQSLVDFVADRKLCICLDEPARIEEHANAVELEFRESMSTRAEKGYILPEQMNVLYGAREIYARLDKNRLLALSTMEYKGFPVKFQNRYAVNARNVSSYNNSFPELVKDLSHYKKNGYRVLLVSASSTRAKRLATDLMDEGLNAFYSDNSQRELQPGEIMTFYGNVLKGFEYPMLKFVVISESDIFGKQNRKKKKKKVYEGQKIRDFSDLKIGDYVVHENHGLGIYKGIEKVEVDKVVKDYIKIEYRDGGNLYILATGLDVIQKYASADAAKRPKLNKLGTQEWTKTKSKVKSAVNEVAKDLVELYAVRQEKQGFAFGHDTVWQQEFEEMFPFEETQDQLLAIEATKADMESSRIMDRLICGDVGYGKTEIAIRAAFKAVQDGKQVAFLVPTTILAQQHYNTFVQRMKDFPVRIDMLSRFRTAGEQKKTLEDLKKGLVDIVIGTHRLLSADVKYKDLGLLIIDEEQRFGVRHKEKIKQVKDTVDVLTLTATPIPRTLHMSLVGIRDMSVLEEAPNERQPIQTYVMEYNEEMVREAIVRELSRQGQVYYVYNRINNIAEITDRIQALVPEATVAYAHGQMKEHELEKIMYGFINGEIDVLVSTTIIETGLIFPM